MKLPFGPEALDSIPMLHSPSPCSDDVFLVIYVHSALEYQHKRNLIRATWGQIMKIQSKRIITIFGLGSIGPQTKPHITKELIANESRRSQDILQFDFVDAYHNLTYKQLLGFRWVNTYCKQAKFLVKVDDDVLVNTPLIMQYLTLPEKFFEGFYCWVLRGSPVQRNKNNFKWGVSKEEYSNHVYPPFCVGFTFVIETKWLPVVYKATNNTRYFKIDDAFVTGILAEKMGIPRSDFKQEHKIMELWDPMVNHIHPTVKKSSSVLLRGGAEKSEKWYAVWKQMYPENTTSQTNATIP